ncbi:MAG: hypothetical protein ACRDS9_06670 [Pseudonocardiaceae bacterium]
MPINTKIEGNPESIRAAARWLRGDLSSGVHDCVTQIYHTRDNAEWAWQGEAASGFRNKMSSGGKKADELAADTDRAGQSIEAFADDLQTAQAGMTRAREIASAAGLQISGDEIAEPGPAPTTPQALPTDGSASPDAVRAHHDAVASQHAHALKVEAYNQAAEEANRSRGIVDGAKSINKNIWDDIRSKAPLHAADFVNGAVVGGLAAKNVSILKQQANRLMDESKLAAQRYLTSPGGSAEARFQNNQAYKKFLEADEAARRAGSIGRRIGSKLPIVGLGITAAGIGYDTSQGKPAGKAIISGVGGALAAAGTGAAIGTAIGGPVGTAVGAAGGLAVGVVTSGVIDWGYDQLPHGVKDGIENGVKAVGNAVGDTGKAIGSGAKKVWDSIF